MAIKHWLSTLMVLVILTSSIYIMMPDSVRIDIGKTYSTFKVYENNYWTLSGQEHTKLFDGTKLMRASNREVNYTINGNETTIYRYAYFKDNCLAVDTYVFDGSTEDLELFPISHQIETFNCEGFLLVYEVTKLQYFGETDYEIGSSHEFGHNMKVEWEEGNYYERLYKYKNVDEGKLTIKYRIEEDYLKKNVRLYDPIIDKDIVFSELLYNHADLTRGEAIFKFNNPVDNLSMTDLFMSYYLAEGIPINSVEFFVEEKVPYSVPIYEENNISYECDIYNNDTNYTEKSICYKIEKEIVNHIVKYNSDWEKRDFLDKGTYEIKLKVYWNAHVGPQKLDWFPNLHLDKDKYELPKDMYGVLDSKWLIQDRWEWFNGSWGYKKEISNLTGNISYLNISKEANGKEGFGDVRFINSTEDGELGYYIQKYENGAGFSYDDFSDELINILVSSYKLDDSSGDILDETANSYDLTYNGALYSQSGKIGTSIGFDGSNDYLINASNEVYPAHTTISFWIKSDDATWDDYHQVGSYFLDGFRLFFDSGTTNVRAHWGSIGNVGATSQYSIGTITNWNHLVGTYNGTTMSLYINGVNVENNIEVGGDLTYTTAPFLVGTQANFVGTRVLDGNIDELSIFNASLSEDAILQLYNAQSAIFRVKNLESSIYMYYNNSDASTTSNIENVYGANLLSAYFLDETSGNVIDSAGSNDGTNSGATRGATGKISSSFDFEESESDYVEVDDGTGAIADTTTEDISINAWVKMESIPAHNSPHVIGGATGGIQFYYRQAGTSLAFGKTGSASVWGSDAVSTGSWHMVTVTYDQTANSVIFYVDGTADSGGAKTYSDTYVADVVYWLGAEATNGRYFDGLIDEVKIFGGKVLSQAEISLLYNTNAPNYVLGSEESGFEDLSPIVTLNSPVDTYNSTSQSITFNCTASDDINLINVSFILDVAYNETNSSGLNNSNYIFSKTLSDGDYNWTCEACDNISQCTNATTRTFTIDTINPLITINSPLNQTYTQSNITFEVLGNEPLDICLYTFDDFVTNQTMTEINSTLFQYNLSLSDGIYYAKFFCNDTTGNVNYSEEIIFSIKVINVTLNSPADEYLSEFEEVTFNCSVDIGDGKLLANLSLFNNVTGVWQLNETYSFFGNGTQLVYDEIDDSSINASLWDRTIISSTFGTNTWTESATTMTIKSETNGVGGNQDVAQEAYTLDFPDHKYISNITYQADLTVYRSDSAGGDDCAITKLYVFGNLVKTLQRCDAGGTSSDSSVYTIVRNSSSGENDFDFFNDDVYQSTFTATNSELKFYTRGVDDASKVARGTIGLAYLYYYLIVTNSTTQTFNKTISDTTLWNCQACSFDGNCDFAEANRSVLLSLDYPTINITYPENLTYFEDITSLNYTASDEFPDKCWYSIDGGVTNSSSVSYGTNFTNVSDSFGLNNWTVYCNDTANRLSQEMIFFTKSIIKFTLNATNSTSEANFLEQNWVYSEVYTYDVNRSNITFNLYTDGGYLDNQTFTNLTDAYNFTGLSLDYYFFNVTICYNDSSGCFTTEERYYGNQTVNLTINNDTLDVIAELGTPINLSTTTNLGNVSFDIIHPNYGTNQNISFLTSTLNLVISYFRNNLFSNSNTYQGLEFNSINNTNNETTFNVLNFSVPIHQYDYIENLSINLSGYVDEGNSTIYLPQIIIYDADNSSRIDRAFYGELVGNNIYVSKVWDNRNGTNLYLSSTNLSFENYGDQLIYLYLDDEATLVSFLLNITGFEYGFEFLEEFNDVIYKDTFLSDTIHFYTWEIPYGTNPQLFVIDSFNDSSINTTLWSIPANLDYDGGNHSWDELRTKTEGANGLVLSSSLSQDFADDEGDTSTIEHSLQVTDLSYLNMVSNNYYTFNFSFSGSGNERVYTQQCEPDTKFYAGDTLIWETYNLFSCVDPSGSCSFTKIGDIFVNISKNYSSNQFNYKLSGTETYHTAEYGGCGDFTLFLNWTNGSFSGDYQSCDDINGLLGNNGSFTLSTTNTVKIYSSTRGDGWQYSANQEACVGDGFGPCAFYQDSKCIAYYFCGSYTSESSCNSYSPTIGSCSWQTTSVNYKGCEAVSNTVTIYDSTQELNSVQNSSYYSTSVFDSSGNVNTVTATAVWNGLASFFLSTDNGENYQSANFSGALTTLINAGQNVKYYTKLIVGSGGYLTNVPYLESLNLSTEKGFPTNISLDFGNDGTYDYTMSYELNTTNSPITANLTLSDISGAFSGTSEVGQTWLVPLRVFSSTRGIVNINSINLTYDPNPVYLNITAIKNYLLNLIGFGDLNISVGAVNGTLNLTDLRYDYSGGNKTYEILAHNPAYSVNNSLNITYYFSQWDYSWIPSGVEWLYFAPKTTISQNVTAYGQTNSIPLMNFTNYGYGGKNVTFSAMIDSSISCANTTLSLTNNESDGIVLNSTFQDITNLTYLQTVNLSFWADYDCNYSNWYLYSPSLYLRTSCEGCVTTTEVI